MRRLRGWFVRLAATFSGPGRERELSEELDSHLQIHIDEGTRAGLQSQEARRRAILALGGIEQTKERWRDQRTIPTVDRSLQDVRYAVRRLWNRPGLSMAAILGLGSRSGWRPRPSP